MKSATASRDEKLRFAHALYMLAEDENATIPEKQLAADRLAAFMTKHLFELDEVLNFPRAQHAYRYNNKRLVRDLNRLLRRTGVLQRNYPTMYLIDVMVALENAIERTGRVRIKAPRDYRKQQKHAESSATIQNRRITWMG
jgi:hypothetical protein